MKRYNIVLLLDADGLNVLMCRRLKPPYRGLLNLVGGKAEPEEDGLHAAYRELREETGITLADTALTHVATFSYPGGGAGLPAYELQAYAGRLRRDIPVCGDENPLCWTPLTEDFFDMEKYAGEGSIGHVLETVRRYRPDAIEPVRMHAELAELSMKHLPVAAYYRQCNVEALQPLLAGSLARQHEGRYFEQFAMVVNGCMAGLASLYAHEDGSVSDGVEIFPPFRKCGIGSQTLVLLQQKARQLGYTRITAQVRTDNEASLMLHCREGFAPVRRFVNRRGNEVLHMEKTLGLRHEMSLRPKPFACIASGEKTYELRLNDEKRRQIRVGDEIRFTCTADGRSVITRVTELRPFADFAALYATLPLIRCGYTAENVHRADPGDMEAYYPPEEQAKHGVLAIGLTRVRCPLELLNGAYAVRELTVDDVPQMLRMARGNPLYYEHLHMEPDEQNLTETLSALPPNRTMADKHIFGWFDGERLIALMDLISSYPKEGMAFIGWFMVDPQMQGQGLGKRMIDEVLRMLRLIGVTEVRLGRVEGNPQSEGFWKACGFSDMPLGYDTDGYHVIVMKKDLT